MAVREGIIQFHNFAGHFTPWSEDLHAMCKQKKAYVWIRLLGLAYQCWYPTAIEAIVSKFGEYISISKNVLNKEMADEARVLVKVEEITAIPRVIICSYRSLVDH